MQRGCTKVPLGASRECCPPPAGTPEPASRGAPLSPQGGRCQPGPRSSPRSAGRAAYPEAGPAEHLHGHGRGNRASPPPLSPPPGPRRAAGEAGPGLSWAGRGSPGPHLPAPGPPSLPPWRRRQAPWPRPAALTPSGREAPARPLSPRRGCLRHPSVAIRAGEKVPGLPSWACGSGH